MSEHPEIFPQTFAEFSEFVGKYQNQLVRHAFYRTGNREEAEDIVQEVLIRMYSDKVIGKKVGKPVSYVFRMVYNASIDRIRKHGRRKTDPVDPGTVVLADSSNREKEIIAQEEFARVNQLLASLPEEQAEVLRLRVFDDLSFVDIAEILKVPVTTIKSRFAYGIEKLRKKITHKEEVNYELQ